METASSQGRGPCAGEASASCRQPECICRLPLGERFVLWAVRQWQVERALPREGSLLHRGFKMAGLLDALPDFAIAMDAVFFGVRRGLAVHQPPCAAVSRDEAVLIALCTLAQLDCDGPLADCLGAMTVPSAARVAVAPLKGFAAALRAAGLRLAPGMAGAAGRVH
jgi:hypothetical protein